MGGAVEAVVKPVAEVVKDVVIEPAKDLGRDVDDFVNEEIPGGWYTVGAVAGGAALGSGALGGATAAEGASLGTGLTAGAGGATGLTAGAGGVTGLTAGTGATLGGLEAGLLAGGATAGIDGALGTGITEGANGIGLTAPTAPSLGAMGGGTGLLAPEIGGAGLVGATGVTAAGAVPMLGDAASMINNPAVIGQPVINYVAPSNALSNVMDTLRTANAVRGMLTPQQAPIPNMQFNQVPQGVVDYSPLLSLLSQRAQRPNVQSLLG